jgi:hypothetical protein
VRREIVCRHDVDRGQPDLGAPQKSAVLVIEAGSSDADNAWEGDEQRRVDENLSRPKKWLPLRADIL